MFPNVLFFGFLIGGCIFGLVDTLRSLGPTRTDAERIKFYRGAVNAREERKREQLELEYWKKKYYKEM